MRKLGLWFVLLAGCGASGSAQVEASTAQTETREVDESGDLDTSLAGVSSPPGNPGAAAPSAGENLGKDPYAGSINRAGLVVIVDQGLGRFFTHLKLAPVLDGKRFVGFAVTAIDPAWGDTGLREGDVLMRVNGQAIERPEHAMAAFEGLRVASEVVVELTRAGVPATLRYRID
jgi:hypothetical protein